MGLSRRRFLGSTMIACLAVGLPPLELFSKPRTAHAQMTARRLVIFHFPNGVFLKDWIPTATGSSWTPTLLMRRDPRDGAGPDIESIRSDINIVTGLTNERREHDAHKGPNADFLAGSVAGTEHNPTGPSIDHVAHVGAQLEGATSRCCSTECRTEATTCAR